MKLTGIPVPSQEAVTERERNPIGPANIDSLSNKNAIRVIVSEVCGKTTIISFRKKHWAMFSRQYMLKLIIYRKSWVLYM